MGIQVDELIDAIERKNGFPLDQPQRDAVRHGNGPLWIIAGPGTGKTEVLVIRCLKLLFCDDIDPESIMVTTFTEKAARNLQDRILDSSLFLASQFPEIQAGDVHKVRTGTLHSLCNDILQEYRYVNYRNLRLLDEIETKMLIRAALASEARNRWPELEDEFSYLFWRRSGRNLWDWTNMLDTLLSRIIEYNLDLDLMRQSGGKWEALAEANEEYERILHERHACDFTRLQKHFLDFLETPQGQLFLDGDTDSEQLPLRYIMVDEYQDTNPIQEEIYFRLAQERPHNIAIVGDDDQALYRFRGGTVECMVGFENRCQQNWNVEPVKVSLVDNHRSHEGIVDWINGYIKSFPDMTTARVQGKPNVAFAAGNNRNYPSVGVIVGANMEDFTGAFADTVLNLVARNIIDDYSQCVLLLRSTKDSPMNAKHYIAALEERDIPVYNPRSKSYVERDEVREVLGTFLSIVDSERAVAADIQQRNISEHISEWFEAYEQIAQNNPSLRSYVNQSQNVILQKAANERIVKSTQAIFYRILSQSPFVDYQNDSIRDLRLSKFSRLLEAFCNQHGRALYTDDSTPGVVSRRWLTNFYYVFCGYLASFGVDDDEEEEVVCPAGWFPLMTIHQSKGLEFDFVFVGSLGRTVSPGGAHHLEAELRPFRLNPSTLAHSPVEAAYHDEIRLHYVAYSRAKQALIMLALPSHLGKENTVSFGEPSSRVYDSYIEKL
ncbi:MAG: UvrD-helicase domain-containing protein [Candidatus Thorarchaeota archaeon]